MKVARRIDPTLADFGVTLSRRFELGDPLLNKLFVAYTVPLGAWEGDPLIGHRFGELARVKDDPGARQRLRDLAVAAADWLVAAGDLDRVEVAVEYFAPGKLALEVDAYPAGGGAAIPVGPFFIATAT